MACACNGRRTFSQIVTSDGSSLPMLKYLHCKYQDQFEALFAAQGITATEANLKLLAEVSDKGLDKAGEIKDKNGKPIYFSVEETVQKIDTTRPVNNFCAV